MTGKSTAPIVNRALATAAVMAAQGIATPVEAKEVLPLPPIPLPPKGQPYVPKGTGTPGSGPFNGGPNNYEKLGIEGELTFDTFGCKVFAANPKTPDWREGSVYFERKFYSGDLIMPDGAKLEMWGFEDTLKSKGKHYYPSPLIRVTEGDLVHCEIASNKGTHTIHHHGIEPTTMNDGVGHVSFEVNGHYTYQWQPHEAGTWFYHCHKNTVLHYEYGMFGLLVVDPPKIRHNGFDRVPAFRGGPVYDVEAFWVVDDIDPRWHELNQNAGLCGEDVGLNVFKPKYFFVSGAPNTKTMTDPRVAVRAVDGDVILIRLVIGSYSVLSTTFDLFDVDVIATDGHALGGTSTELGKFSRPWARRYTVKAGEPILLSSAERVDLLIDTAKLKASGQLKAAGSVCGVRMEYQDWITRKVHNANSAQAAYRGIAETRITVAAKP